MARARVTLGEMLADPFGILRRLRAEGPVADVVELGTVAVLRYEDVRALLADRRLHADFGDFLRSIGVASGPFYEWMLDSPLSRGGADHQRWRALMLRTFTPRSVERLRPFLGRAAHALIDGFAARGACEFVAEFADAYPSLGLCELIGVPAEDRDRFRGWANTIGLGFSPFVAMHIAAVDDALTQLLSYSGELAAARRADPRDDLVSRIATAAAQEDWSDADVRGSIAGLVFAGQDTTKNQLGWMVAVLAERDDLWDAVARQSLSPADVVEEVLRSRSSIGAITRTAAEAIQAGGVRVEGGQRVLLSVWSANSDERAFPHPERIDPAHNVDIRHLAFGHGPHHCLGAALARAQLQEALAALTVRIGCPAVAAGATWRPPVGISGPTHLPLTFTPR
jgi:cytochrome P450